MTLATAPNPRIADYECWRVALAGGDTSRFPKGPQCGFWRRGANGEQVAIWRGEDGRLLAKIGARAPQVANIEFDESVFGYCLPHPISHDVYTAICNGEPWPTIDPIVHGQVGHNSASVDDLEALRDQIAAAIERAKVYSTVADDETAARAQSLRARLLELAGEVKEKHKAEKEPHLKAGREVDAKWLPLAKQADAVASTIRAAMSKHETEKARKEAEARRKAEAGAEARRNTPQSPPALASTPEPPRAAPIRGGYGRAASVRVVKVAVVIDQDAAYRVFRANPEIVALIQKLAQKAVDAGATVAGVEVEERRKVA